MEEVIDMEDLPELDSSERPGELEHVLGQIRAILHAHHSGKVGVKMGEEWVEVTPQSLFHTIHLSLMKIKEHGSSMDVQIPRNVVVTEQGVDIIVSLSGTLEVALWISTGNLRDPLSWAVQDGRQVVSAKILFDPDNPCDKQDSLFSHMLHKAEAKSAYHPNLIMEIAKEIGMDVTFSEGYMTSYNL